MQIQMLPSNDNYIYLLHHGDKTAVVDPAVAEPVIEQLEQRQWSLDHIFITHHHSDHTGGNIALKQRYGCQIIGAQADSHRVPGLDIAVSEGEPLHFAGQIVDIFEVPGHTSAHLAFRIGQALFSGDSLFALGCGRLFEGTPAQMWHSLCKLRVLPDDTLVYCGHEYTEVNARFCLSVDPDNPDLQEYAGEVFALRTAGKPTVPSTLGRERRSNSFLRADDPQLAARLGLMEAPPEEVFAEIRRRKDRFKPGSVGA